MKDLLTYLGEKLAADGYGGLCSEWCGCELADLAPCGGQTTDCSPGYKHACAECPRAAEDNCPMEDGGVGMCVNSTKDWPAVTP